ncbi:MAG: hypothetical protein KF745_05205 [Phycisphaeraceae bacterium]|nr:hypothetical protein [Phycisphaeraceae bacterium]
MIIRDWLGRLDRIQRSLLFQIIASVVLVLAAAGVQVGYVVSIHASERGSEAATTPAPAPDSPDAKAAKTAQTNQEMFEKAFGEILSRRADATAVAVGIGIVLAMCLAIVWLGLGLTYLALGLFTAAIVWPMQRFGGHVDLLRDASGKPGVSFDVAQWGQFIAGLVALFAAFTVLMRVLKLALGGNGPVFSIARNVVDEAVRLKISLVFIVMLIFMLASLPGLLDPARPLRYRVQSFLQYGTSGSFWIIAVLVLFLAVASVAFEQRDRVIWQTMTKPVASWQYILGKWLGVTGVAAALLAISASGVFLFTEHLRNQPAEGEIRPFVTRNGAELTDDRVILESQVLAARVAVRPGIDAMPPEALEQAVEHRLEQERRLNNELPDDAATRARLRASILQEYRSSFYSLKRGQVQRYYFRGLGDARESGTPLTLRYKINAGGDDPRFEYRVLFFGASPQFFFENDSQLMPVVEGEDADTRFAGLERRVPPGQQMRLSISPTAVSKDGTLELEIGNGGLINSQDEAQTIVFPPDGLELSFNAGSYRMNFFRVGIILWLKLSFLAMIGITCATFLSFPVASLVAFGVFLIAESSGYLAESLEYYASRTDKGEVILYKVIIRAIAVPISETFRYYANLRPTANLVDGRLVAWTGVLQSTVILGAVTGILFVLASAIFRRRELATYSGQ